LATFLIGTITRSNLCSRASWPNILEAYTKLLNPHWSFWRFLISIGCGNTFSIWTKNFWCPRELTQKGKSNGGFYSNYPGLSYTIRPWRASNTFGNLRPRLQGQLGHTIKRGKQRRVLGPQKHLFCGISHHWVINHTSLTRCSTGMYFCPNTFFPNFFPSQHWA